MSVILGVYVFAIGAVIGSFLNVVIHRYPREQSVVFPPSRCPHCQERIRWYDNIPIFSYVFLLGRCRRCKASISLRYPLVELANALFYLAIYLRLGLTIPTFLLAALVSMTIALMYIDAEIQILPDVIDIPGIGLGLLLAFVPVAVRHDLVLARGWKDALIGAALGAGVILAIAGTYFLLRRTEGMGMGDVKMLAMIGAILGWRPLYAVILIASLAGALVGLVTAAAKQHQDLRFPLPFGVFLGFAFLVTLFFGERYLFPLVPVLRLGG